jgi:hypothetical protein
VSAQDASQSGIVDSDRLVTHEHPLGLVNSTHAAASDKFAVFIETSCDIWQAIDNADKTNAAVFIAIKRTVISGNVDIHWNQQGGDKQAPGNDEGTPILTATKENIGCYYTQKCDSRSDAEDEKHACRSKEKFKDGGSDLNFFALSGICIETTRLGRNELKINLHFGVRKCGSSGCGPI